MQFLYPLTVFHIGFLAFNVLGKLSIAEGYVKTHKNQDGVQVLTLIARTFHSSSANVVL